MEIFVTMRPMFFEICIVTLQEFRSIEIIWTFFLTPPTAKTVFNLLHFLVKFISQIYLVRSTTQEEIHAVATLNLDTCRAGLAIATPAAKVA